MCDVFVCVLCDVYVEIVVVDVCVCVGVVVFEF